MADHVYSTGALAPHQRHVRLRPNAKTRQFLENALERLLGAAEAVLADLDALDGDADFEPSSGASHTVLKVGKQLVDIDDADHDGREPPEDEELTLGWDSRMSQLSLGAPSDDREPELGEPERIDQSRWGTVSRDASLGWLVEDGEPLLSASEEIDQRSWVKGDRRDLEEQHEGEGDHDEREPEIADDSRVYLDQHYPERDDLPALKARLDHHRLRTANEA